VEKRYYNGETTWQQLDIQRGVFIVDKIYLRGYPNILAYFGSHTQMDSIKKKVMLQCSLERKY
jgi:hypothetical protein